MIVTLYGKSGNKYTQQVREELEDAWPDYKFLEQFDWARDRAVQRSGVPYRERRYCLYPEDANYPFRG